MSIRTKWTFDQIFSYSHLQETEKKLAGVKASITAYVSNPLIPTSTFLFVGRKKWTNDSHYGIITCPDVESIEAIRCRISTTPQTSLRMLIGGCVSRETRLTTDEPIVLFILLNAELFVQRSIRINMNWCRRMWHLASRAHMIAVTGVYYSVLGGAYCSLGKTNTKYAYKAGVLAIEQIKLAKKLKDPILECKCWLYFAEDLIQLGKLEKVDKIIMRQKVFVLSIDDITLTSMLESVVNKLDIAKEKDRTRTKAIKHILATQAIPRVIRSTTRL